MDAELNAHMKLTSANSINVARFLPQSFYYFWAYAQMKKMGLPVNATPCSKNPRLVACVPSGNFGNICSALFGRKMGLPIDRFIAANNANDIFYQYLLTGQYNPRPSTATIANAMDVGDPSNFARILDLYAYSHEDICRHIAGATYTDQQIADTMRQCLSETGYQLDPHGACGYQALKDGLAEGEIGFFLETAHPAKFKQVVDDICHTDVEIPARLAAFMQGEKQSVEMPNDFQAFKQFLLAQ
jgi:threonine synthase